MNQSIRCVLVAFYVFIVSQIRLSAQAETRLLAGVKRKPNVVIFYADDLGWGDLRCHNPNPEDFRYTPSIDRIFARGVEFSNYVTHSLCSPSRAGLLTGKHYSKVASGPATGGSLPHKLPNIAKDFKSAGYRTGAFGKWHNGYPSFPEDGKGESVTREAMTWNELHRRDTMNLEDNILQSFLKKWGVGVNAYGFDRFVGYYGGGPDLFDRFSPWFREIAWFHDKEYRSDEKGYTTDLITKHAIDFISNSKGEPFFCYIPHEAVHTPFHLKRKDFREFCEKLEKERGMPGKWDLVREVKSPMTGKLLGDVEALRCSRHEEFDLWRVQEQLPDFPCLVYAAYLYSLDKSIGEVIKKVENLGLMEETIFVFSSDNGATGMGSNRPFKGGKNTLYEGGIHVPAAIWWPGNFDCETGLYRSGDNKYEGYIGYTDLYPTLMAMSGQPCTGKDLDGQNVLPQLMARKECRPELADAMFWMSRDYGVVRTKRWKLLYSEAKPLCQLFDLSTDIEEIEDVGNSNPVVRDALIGRYREWIKDNNFGMTYHPIDRSNIQAPQPSPSGSVIEIKARQIKAIARQGDHRVDIRFANASDLDFVENYIHPRDRIQFDIFVCEDSTVNQGCYYSPTKVRSHLYSPQNGINQDGRLIHDLHIEKGVWTRQVLGIGNLCGGNPSSHVISLRSEKPGYYHYYLDNIVILKGDGSLRSVIWSSKEHFLEPTFIYRNKEHRNLSKLRSTEGFPFSSIDITSTELHSLEQSE